MKHDHRERRGATAQHDRGQREGMVGQRPSSGGKRRGGRRAQVTAVNSLWPDGDRPHVTPYHLISSLTTTPTSHLLPTVTSQSHHRHPHLIAIPLTCHSRGRLHVHPSLSSLDCTSPFIPSSDSFRLASSRHSLFPLIKCNAQWHLTIAYHKAYSLMSSINFLRPHSSLHFLPSFSNPLQCTGDSREKEVRGV